MMDPELLRAFADAAQHLFDPSDDADTSALEREITTIVEEAAAKATYSDPAMEAKGRTLSTRMRRLTAAFIDAELTQPARAQIRAATLEKRMELLTQNSIVADLIAPQKAADRAARAEALAEHQAGTLQKRFDKLTDASLYADIFAPYEGPLTDRQHRSIQNLIYEASHAEDRAAAADARTISYAGTRIESALSNPYTSELAKAAKIFQIADSSLIQLFDLQDTDLGGYGEIAANMAEGFQTPKNAPTWQKVVNFMPLSPLIKGLFGMFAHPEKPEPLIKYLLPDREDFQATEDASGRLQYSDADQYGRTREVSPFAPPPHITGPDVLQEPNQANPRQWIADNAAEIANAIKQQILNSHTLGDVILEL